MPQSQCMSDCHLSASRRHAVKNLQNELFTFQITVITCHLLIAPLVKWLNIHDEWKAGAGWGSVDWVWYEGYTFSLSSYGNNEPLLTRIHVFYWLPPLKGSGAASGNGLLPHSITGSHQSRFTTVASGRHLGPASVTLRGLIQRRMFAARLPGV